MLPLESGVPALGRTPTGVVSPIVMASAELEPVTDSVTVSVAESVTAMLAAVMFRPAAKVMLGVAAVLNSKPAGAFRMSVPPPMSPLPPPGFCSQVERWPLG